MIHVMLVESRPAVLQGLRMRLAIEPDISVVAEAGDGERAVQLALELRPGVVLMEADLPRLDGLTAARAIRAAAPETAVVILTLDCTSGLRADAEAAGAAALVEKCAGDAHLLATIRAVAGAGSGDLPATREGERSSPLRPGAGVSLRPMDDQEYGRFAGEHVAEYAAMEVRAGNWAPEEAPDRSREELQDLLQDALRARGHRFFRAMSADGEPVAWVWEGPPPVDLAGTRWLYQITVSEALRRRGFGGATLEALEGMLAAEGTAYLQLNVHKWNQAAVGLYTKRGYALVGDFGTEMHMRKQLLPPTADL